MESSLSFDKHKSIIIRSDIEKSKRALEKEKEEVEIMRTQVDSYKI